MRELPRRVIPVRKDRLMQEEIARRLLDAGHLRGGHKAERREDQALNAEDAVDAEVRSDKTAIHQLCAPRRPQRPLR